MNLTLMGFMSPPNKDTKMAEKILLITIIIPTICYVVNAGLSVYNGQPYFGLMWFGYALANCAILKTQGIV